MGRPGKISKNTEPGRISFGARFGHLLKTYRGEQGLTQQQLAVRAFDDEARKSRMSDLENGKIPNPQQKTVDLLVAALGITSEQVMDCRHPIPALPPGFQAELGLADGIVENLAMRFGHENSDAGRTGLVEFLKDKARDYKALKARLDELATAEARIANQVAAAKAALDNGNFDEADTVLANAEEMQQAEHTLPQIRKQAALRATRAEAALLKGDAEAAHNQFGTAADFFDAFDPFEGAQHRNGFAAKLYDHGLRYGGPALAGAETLCRLNLAIWIEADHPFYWALTQNNLGEVLRSRGERTPGQDGIDLLTDAITADQAALRMRSETNHPLDWALTQNNLSKALLSKGKRTSGQDGTDLLADAAIACREALRVFSEADHPLGWAMTHNNLCNALVDQGERTPGQAGMHLLAHAVTAGRAALRFYTQADHPLRWAMAYNNLGNALLKQGERTPGQAGTDLLSNAATSYKAALNVYTEVDHPLLRADTQNNLGNAFRGQGERTPDRAGADIFANAEAAFRVALTERTEANHPLDWAMTHNNLGNTLVNQGERTPGQAGTNLLTNAVTAYRTALQVRTKADHPLAWAMTQENIGQALWRIAYRQTGAEQLRILQESLEAFDSALTVFEPENTGFYYQKCQRARDEVEAGLRGESKAPS